MIHLAQRAHNIWAKQGTKALMNSIEDFVYWNLTRQIRKEIDPQRLRLYRALSGNRVVCRDVQGSLMALNSTRPGIDQELILDGIRERAATQRFRQLLFTLQQRSDNPIIVFDIGANIGYFTLIEADVLEKKHIYAFEPGPDNIKELFRNVAINGYGSDVTLVRAAVGENTGRRSLDVGSKANLHRITDVNGESSGDEIDVDLVTVDGMLEQFGIDQRSPLILRIDVEGYESAVISGAKSVIDNTRDVLVFIEFHEHRIGHEATKIIKQFEDAGFTLDFASPDGGRKQMTDATFDDLKDMSGNFQAIFRRGL
jgi:FkbM family methyltransferase